jgi:hypothetical protein
VAGAQQLCEDDGNVGPNRVYILAADTQVPIIKALGAKLRAQTPALTLIWSPNGSCSNVTYLYNDTFTPNTTAGGTFYIPKDYDGKAAPPNCTPAPDQKPDLAISIVFPDATNCPSAPARPGTVGVTQGPVQAMVLAVPGGVGTGMGSTQTAITAEEAYLVFGLGADKGMVAPWTDPNFTFGRPTSKGKGTQISIGANIGVPNGKWKLINDADHQIDQSSDVPVKMTTGAAAGAAEKVLGILGVEIYDLVRATVHSLAFRAYGQRRSYWPDAQPSSFEKRNVRDGHYPIWSYVQFLFPTDGSTPAARNAGAQKLVDLIVGNAVTLTPPFEPLDSVISAHLVPACAMKVARSVEGGPITPAKVAQPCGCYFDAKAPMSTTSCAACSESSPCAGGKSCRHGYCEER